MSAEHPPLDGEGGRASARPGGVRRQVPILRTESVAFPPPFPPNDLPGASPAQDHGGKPSPRGGGRCRPHDLYYPETPA